MILTLIFGGCGVYLTIHSLPHVFSRKEQD